jgi:predicted transcriptional regulator
LYFSAATLRSASDLAHDLPDLPHEIRCLFRRERQVAAIVYECRLATAKEVEAQLHGMLTNAAVRSMLKRLVGKGILFHYKCRTRGQFIYCPALTESLAREAALEEFAADFCAGSVAWLACDLEELFTFAPSRAELVSGYDQAPPQDVEDLAPRMREIATVVYRSGVATLCDVQAAITDPLTKHGIRTLINRLVDRGIIRKRRSGRHREFVFIAGRLTVPVRRIALARLIDDRFDGSAGAALQATVQLMQAQRRRVS